MFVQLLIDQIEDEKRMFAGAALTRAERDQMAFNERLLAIATQIKKSHAATEEETYVMPQHYDKDRSGTTQRQQLLKSRYKCAPDMLPCRAVLSIDSHVVLHLLPTAPRHMSPTWSPWRREDKQTDEGTAWGEQEALEQAALARSGAAGTAVADHPDAAPQYDFVEDDHIDFVVMETVRGELDGSESSSEDEQEKQRKVAEVAKLSKREKIAAARRALPSYAYKDEFIKAVMDNQVRLWCRCCTRPAPLQVARLLVIADRTLTSTNAKVPGQCRCLLSWPRQAQARRHSCRSTSLRPALARPVRPLPTLVPSVGPASPPLAVGFSAEHTSCCAKC